MKHRRAATKRESRRAAQEAKSAAAMSEKLKRAERENARLRREITGLRRELDKQPDANEPLRLFRRKNRTDREKRIDRFKGSAANAHRYAKRTYVTFLIDTVTGSSLFDFIMRVTLHLRRLTFVRTIAAVVTVILTALAVSAVYLTFLPVFLALTAVSLMSGFFCSARRNREMRRLLNGKHIIIFIPPDPLSFKEDSFFIRNARMMAADPHIAVIVISPHTLSSVGLGGRGPYLTARHEGDDLFIVRKNYYFILRRRVLERIDKDLTVVYG